jgi:hypothetical protein
MTLHIAAFRSNADQAGAAANLAAVTDQAVATEGNFVRVPSALQQLVGEAFFTGTTTAFTSAQVQSPTLRQLVNQNLGVRGLIADDSKIMKVQWHPHIPRAMAANEGIEFVTNTDAAGAIELHGLVWLADGAIAPVNGNMFTTRATAAITAVNTGWTNGLLTFTERLPYGNYDVVGMRALAADGTAARLVFPGLPFRPGVPVDQAESIDEPSWFRYGRAGVLGTFDLNQPPTLEVFGGAATAQVIYLDLIKRN